MHPVIFSGIAVGYRLDNWRFDSRQGLGILLLTTASRLALGPTQPRIQWILWLLSTGDKGAWAWTWPLISM